jgi:glyoxylase-like metal-dependent hydrolase (beta-lactamase superfamily II)
MNFYSHEKVADRVYVVTENYSKEERITMGVFVGGERVLVIDSGLGICGDLRKYIESFVGTEKPMLCMCTDGHTDRVGGAMLFDEAYLNHLDYEKFKSSAFDMSHRLKAVDQFTHHKKEIVDYCDEVKVDNSHSSFLDIKDGDMFHLGGMRIEVIGLPGHSAGTLAYMSRKDKTIFVGDALDTETSLLDLDREGLIAYRDTLNRFVSMLEEDINIYSGHSTIPKTIKIAQNIAQACEEITTGQVAGDLPVKTPLADRDTRMHFVNNTCVIYNHDLLGNKEN